MKPRMFIVSSSEAIDIAHAVQLGLQSKVEVTVWDQSAIGPSTSVVEALETYITSSDFALFVFNPDDSVRVRGQESPAVRDNVIFELGLFASRLGKSRCFILVPDEEGPRIPTDLLGTILLKYESGRRDRNLRAAVAAACYQIGEAVDGLGLRVPAPGSPTGGPDMQDNQEISDSGPSLDAAEEVGDEPPGWGWLLEFLGKRYDRAIELIEERIAEVASDESERLTLEGWLGRVKYAKDPKEDGQYLRRLIDKHPEDHLLYIHLAGQLSVYQRLTEAIEVLDSGISTAKDASELITKKAAILVDMGNQEEGLATLRQGLDLYPQDSGLYIQLAERLLESGQYEGAKSIISAGIQVVIENEVLLARLARLLSENSERDLALLRYNQLLVLKPHSPEYLALRANLFLDLNLPDLAMRDYKKANELSEEKQGWILENIGNLYANLGLYRG